MYRRVVFIIPFIGWKLHIKKEVKYKQRCEIKRALFTEQIKDLAIEQILYIDETGIDNNLSKLRGWSLKGTKSFTEALGFRTKRVTLIGGYCYGTKELVAPMEYDGYTNSHIFLSWVELALCKALKPNQVVIMDNASFDKSTKVKDLIGTLIPIELVWNNLNRLIRFHPYREENQQNPIDESIGILFMV